MFGNVQLGLADETILLFLVHFMRYISSIVRMRKNCKRVDHMDVCLPLSLQDLCLLEAINDLDSYPVELLSSLPHWLRHRLFNNLPAGA